VSVVSRHVANRPGLIRAIGWIDHYLAMPLKPDVKSGFEDLKKRLEYERDCGPLTSVLMGHGHTPEKGGE